MIIRKAILADIDQMHAIRMAVRENVLSDPTLISEQDYANYLENRGSGWVVEVGDRVLGFSIVDLADHNVWALFVHPDFEKKGIGRLLHDELLDWYFSQTEETIWLGTEVNSRAANFYRSAGWVETGKQGSNEIRFEFYASSTIRT
jgi:GNAT superfamily N-acetyltransferase